MCKVVWSTCQLCKEMIIRICCMWQMNIYVLTFEKALHVLDAITVALEHLESITEV